MPKIKYRFSLTQEERDELEAIMIENNKKIEEAQRKLVCF